MEIAAAQGEIARGDDTDNGLGWQIGHHDGLWWRINQKMIGEKSDQPVTRVAKRLPRSTLWLPCLMTLICFGFFLVSIVGEARFRHAGIHTYNPWAGSDFQGTEFGWTIDPADKARAAPMLHLRDFGMLGAMVFGGAAGFVSARRDNRSNPQLFHEPVDMALLNRLPTRAITDPCVVVEALHTILDDTDEVVTQRRSQRCLKLLEDDFYADDVVELLRTVAATDNPKTLEAARRAIDELHASRKKAKKLAKVQEVEHSRALLEVQPDYTDDIDRIMERRQLLDTLERRGIGS